MTIARTLETHEYQCLSLGKFHLVIDDDKACLIHRHDGTTVTRKRNPDGADIKVIEDVLASFYYKCFELEQWLDVAKQELGKQIDNADSQT